jgi:thiamine-monophosphate kinase
VNLRQWGEDGLLEYLSRELGGGHTPAWAQVGVGDDAAVFQMPGGPGKLIVATADAMVEGIHFHSGISAHSLARRLLNANLSDLAAMAARPRLGILTLGAPADTPREWIERFFTSLRDAAKEEQTWIAGGDTTADESLHLSLFLLGEADEGQVLRMDAGSPGEDIWITGNLGDAALGLRLLEEDIDDREGEILVRYHLEGRQRWREMQEISSCAVLGAATDVSDGLAVDLPRLCRKCSCCATINCSLIPTSNQLEALTSRLGYDRLPLCLAGGEDFEVLFTAPPDQRAILESMSDQGVVRLSRIGSLEAGEPGQVSWLDGEGRELDFDNKGYDHFRRF